MLEIACQAFIALWPIDPNKALGQPL